MAKYERVPLASVDDYPFSTTVHTSRQARALENSVRRFGQIQPLVVRQDPSGSQQYECIDGSARLVLLRTLGWSEVDVLNVGPMLGSDVMEMHMVLNLDHGRPAPDPLADMLEKVVRAPSTAHARAYKELELLELLPLVGSGIGKTIERLRRQAAPKPMPKGTKPGWVDFRIKVDPSAAKVCDRALSHVEQTTQCKRNVAFERICADYLAGARGGQP